MIVYNIPLPGCLRFEKMNMTGAEQLTLTKWKVSKDFQADIEYVLISNNIPFTRGRTA